MIEEVRYYYAQKVSPIICYWYLKGDLLYAVTRDGVEFRSLTYTPEDAEMEVQQGTMLKVEAGG